MNRVDSRAKLDAHIRAKFLGSNLMMPELVTEYSNRCHTKEQNEGVIDVTAHSENWP